MDRYDLNLIQIGKWRETIERHLKHYQQTLDRMQLRQYKTNDPLWRDVHDVQKAIRQLLLDLHHLAIEKRHKTDRR